MIPVKLSLHNFLSYADAELDFSPFDLAVLTGPNGVGKSSLLEAITWCVWEQARASSDELIRQGEQLMWVELVFEHEGGVYRVVRRRVRKTRGGETTLEFQVKNHQEPGTIPVTVPGTVEQWRSLTEATIRQTQEKIVKTLRLAYEIFVNSSYLRQGHADEFTIKTPSERKAILAEILGLSLYDILEERAKEKKRETEVRLQLTALQAEELKKQLERKGEIEATLKQIKQRHGSGEKELKIAQNNLEKLGQDRLANEKISHQLELERKHFATLQEQIKKLMTEKDTTSREIQQLEQTLRNAPTIELRFKEYQKVKKELDELSHKIMVAQELQQQLAVGESKQIDLGQTIKRLSELRSCPTCLRPLPKAEAIQIIKTLESEFAKTTGRQVTAVKASLAKLGFSRQHYEQLRTRYRKLEGVADENQALKVAKAKIEEKTNFRAKLERQLVEMTQQISAITASGRKLKLEAVKFEQAAKRHDQEKARLAQLQTQQAELARQLGGLDEQLRAIRAVSERAEQLAKETIDLQGQAQAWQTLTLAFSKRGIQAMIIEQSLPAIEQEANLILGRLSDGRLRVKFETQRAKKTPLRQGDGRQAGELIETLDIIVSDELGERAYEMFSGGEGFRINFAIRVAISKLLSMRAGAKLRFLAVDEGFGMLDQAGQQDIIAAINSVRQDFAKVIVVSHIESIKDAFQTRIEVSKGVGGSRIEVMS